MERKFLKILTWFGIMAVLTAVAMTAWYACGGNQTTTSLKWLQFAQTVATFLLPPILCAWLWEPQHRPFTWLKLDRTANGSTLLMAVAIMLCAMPGINLLADLNSRIELPESLDFIEQILKQQEQAAAALTERFLQADHVGILLLNIGLMALLPALAEELSFRGILQQILTPTPQTANPLTPHLAIWITAFIFSAIHMQFYGFVPRMLMGALFGYMFVWTGCLWVPVLMHFTNNCMAVLAYYFSDEIGQNGINYADTIGAGTTWYIGVISLVITSLGLLIFYRRTHTR